MLFKKFLYFKFCKKKTMFWLIFTQAIKEKSEQEASEKKFTLNECNKANNRRLNRYRDVSPYDHSRIILHRGDIDYINANLVKMEKANRKYILTQGPLPHTVGHFWLMVWEYNCAAILMLNKVIEKRQVKCHQYWPDRIGAEHTMHLNDVGLTVEFLKCENYANFSKRTFRLTDTESSKSREVIQFHYTTWPDFCVPSSPVAFLQFLKKVRDSGALNSDVGPAVVHCSAGIGRSGTFCLVDSCLVLVEKEGENKISVADLLLELRQSRMGLIQTADQLYFSYQAIIEGIKHFPVFIIFILMFKKIKKKKNYSNLNQRCLWTMCLFKCNRNLMIMMKLLSPKRIRTIHHRPRHRHDQHLIRFERILLHCICLFSFCFLCFQSK